MPRPNIVLIMTDQQRADLCAREGFPLDTTPFLDSLAGQGVWFDRAYTATPICGPARVSMLTGRYPSVTHVRENRATSLAYYEKDLIDVLKEQGYSTAMVGKNHSHLRPDRVDHWFELSHGGGRGEGRREQEKAFDYWLVGLNHGVAREPAPFPVECQGPYRAVSDAQQWLGSLPTGQPFFMWLTFAEPHNPYQAPEPYFDLFPPQSLPPTLTDDAILPHKGFIWEFTRRLGEHVYPNYGELLPRMRSNYCGMLRLIDDQVKRFVGWLEQRGLRDDTILIFVSDHGDFCGEYGLMRKGPEIPNMLNRVPFLIAGAGIRAHKGPHPAHISLVDLMPTLCEALGTSLPRGVQGRSLWPMLTGEGYPAEEFASVYAEQGFGGRQYTAEDHPNLAHCLIPGPKGPSFDCLNSYSQSGIMRMVRKGDWRLIFDVQGRGQLYNLVDDPLELTDLFDDPQYIGKQRELLAELLMWTLRTQDPLPYPVGKYIYKEGAHNYWTPRNPAEDHPIG